MAGAAVLKGILNFGKSAYKAFGKTAVGDVAFGTVGLAKTTLYNLPKGGIRTAYKGAKVLAKSGSYKPGGALSALRSSTKAGKTIIKYDASREIGLRAGKRLAQKTLDTGEVLAGHGSKIKQGLHKMGHVGLQMARSGPGKSLLRGGFALGATAMLGLSVMKGGMNEAKEIVHERYLQDYTYSRSMLHNSRVGLASGTNRMLNRGGTQGLTLGLSKTRHGRY